MYPSTIRVANFALLSVLLSQASLTHAALQNRQNVPSECTVDDDHITCPPGITPPGDCHTHEPNEWHCAADPTTTETITTTPTSRCETLTTITGIDYTITDYFEDFFPKIQTAWEEVKHESDLINVYTVTAGEEIGYAYVPREVLEKAGFTDFKYYTTTTPVPVPCEDVPTATGTITSTHTDDDDHGHTGTGDLPPSPTGSSCSAHGNHWDCEPLPTTTTHDDDEHTGTGVLPPSPTGSSCSAHGDHWDCEPLPTTTTRVNSNVTTDVNPPEETDSAAATRFDGPAFFGTIGLMVSVFIAGLIVA